MVERLFIPDCQLIPIPELVGQCVVINPRRLINSKALYATQDWTDIEKASRALIGTSEDLLPAIHLGDINDTNGRTKRIAVVGDGTHRIGVACIEGEEICAQVIGTWDFRLKKYGFNKIIQQLLSLKGGCGFY